VPQGSLVVAIDGIPVASGEQVQALLPSKWDSSPSKCDSLPSKSDSLPPKSDSLPSNCGSLPSKYLWRAGPGAAGRRGAHGAGALLVLRLIRSHAPVAGLTHGGCFDARSSAWPKPTRRRAPGRSRSGPAAPPSQKQRGRFSQRIWCHVPRMNGRAKRQCGRTLGRVHRARGAGWRAREHGGDCGLLGRAGLPLLGALPASARDRAHRARGALQVLSPPRPCAAML
jgi:hypothetical protein